MSPLQALANYLDAQKRDLKGWVTDPRAQLERNVANWTAPREGVISKGGLSRAVVDPENTFASPGNWMGAGVIKAKGGQWPVMNAGTRAKYEKPVGKILTETEKNFTYKEEFDNSERLRFFKRFIKNLRKHDKQLGKAWKDILIEMKAFKICGETSCRYCKNVLRDYPDNGDTVPWYKEDDHGNSSGGKKRKR